MEEEAEEDLMAMEVVEEVEEDMTNLFAAEKGVLRKQIACAKTIRNSGARKSIGVSCDQNKTNKCNF